jgi:hypothetical protein
VTCMEALDSLLDYEAGAGGLFDTPAYNWPVCRAFAPDGIFVVPPVGITPEEWAAAAPPLASLLSPAEADRTSPVLLPGLLTPQEAGWLIQLGEAMGREQAAEEVAGMWREQAAEKQAARGPEQAVLEWAATEQAAGIGLGEAMGREQAGEERAGMGREQGAVEKAARGRERVATERAARGQGAAGLGLGEARGREQAAEEGAAPERAAMGQAAGLGVGGARLQDELAEERGTSGQAVCSKGGCDEICSTRRCEVVYLHRRRGAGQLGERRWVGVEGRRDRAGHAAAGSAVDTSLEEAVDKSRDALDAPYDETLDATHQAAVAASTPSSARSLSALVGTVDAPPHEVLGASQTVDASRDETLDASRDETLDASQTVDASRDDWTLDRLVARLLSAVQRCDASRWRLLVGRRAVLRSLVYHVTYPCADSAQDSDVAAHLSSVHTPCTSEGALAYPDADAELDSNAAASLLFARTQCNSEGSLLLPSGEELDGDANAGPSPARTRCDVEAADAGGEPHSEGRDRGSIYRSNPSSLTDGRDRGSHAMVQGGDAERRNRRSPYRSNSLADRRGRESLPRVEWGDADRRDSGSLLTLRIPLSEPGSAVGGELLFPPQQHSGDVGGGITGRCVGGGGGPARAQPTAAAAVPFQQDRGDGALFVSEPKAAVGGELLFPPQQKPAAAACLPFPHDRGDGALFEGGGGVGSGVEPVLAEPAPVAAETHPHEQPPAASTVPFTQATAAVPSTHEQVAAPAAVPFPQDRGDGAVGGDLLYSPQDEPPAASTVLFPQDRGDGALFVSEKRHRVSRVESGCRRDLVLEIWDGPVTRFDRHR